jgi:hypothetical protein
VPFFKRQQQQTKAAIDSFLIWLSLSLLSLVLPVAGEVATELISTFACFLLCVPRKVEKMALEILKRCPD